MGRKSRMKRMRRQGTLTAPAPKKLTRTHGNNADLIKAVAQAEGKGYWDKIKELNALREQKKGARTGGTT